MQDKCIKGNSYRLPVMSIPGSTMDYHMHNSFFIVITILFVSVIFSAWNWSDLFFCPFLQKQYNTVFWCNKMLSRTFFVLLDGSTHVTKLWKTVKPDVKELILRKTKAWECAAIVRSSEPGFITFPIYNNLCQKAK